MEYSVFGEIAMADNRKVKELTVDELSAIMKDAPKGYINETCKVLHKHCQHNWNKDIHEFGEKVTGLDTRKPESKQHIRGVYEYADSSYEKSKLVKTTIFVESVKWIGVAFAIFLGLKK